MIYIIDHKDSFTHNVVHQFSSFDEVQCDDYNEINRSLLNKASVIVLSPGPGSPKDYPKTSNIYNDYKGKKKLLEFVWVFNKFYTARKAKLFSKIKFIMDINQILELLAIIHCLKKAKILRLVDITH